MSDKHKPADDELQKLARENKRLKRGAKRQEMQLQQLDRMAKANEKININLYNELEVLSKQAEAQAREAQIEAALERVRTRAMAMDNSDDLAGAIAVVFRELNNLGISTIRCGIAIIDAASKTMETWIATTTEEGEEVQVPGRLEVEGNPTLERVFAAWQEGAPTLSYELEGEELERYYQSISSDLRLPEREAHHQRQVVSLFYFPEGGLYTYTTEPLSEEALQIFQKFTRVFAMTYRRYLDLKRAEAQAREAQIEAALERVRGRAMAMHQSDDVAAATVVLFDELNNLGVTSVRCGIAIPLDSKTLEFWAAASTEDGESTRVVGTDSLNLHPALQNAYDAWKAKEPGYTFTLQGKDLTNYYRAVFPTMPIPEWQERMRSATGGREEFTTFCFSDGWIYIFTNEPLSDEANNILQRFAQVFDLTYRRYLDLRQAEEQARKAQIEAALERVRARTMAMHQSDELQEVIGVMFEQLKSLDFLLDVCALDLIEKGSKDLTTWTASPQQIYVQQGRIPYFNHPVLNTLGRARRKPGSITTLRLPKPEIRSWYKHVIANSPFGSLMSAERKRAVMKAERLDMTFAIATQTGLIIGNFGAHEYTDVENRTALRFSHVFEQTYRRFLDLQKAEEQAREAQVEAALERVRGRAMAMHQSEELAETASVMFREFRALTNIETGTGSGCWISIIDSENKVAENWGTDFEGDILPLRFRLPQTEHPVLAKNFEAWKRQEPLIVTDLPREAFVDFTQYISLLPDFATDTVIREALANPPDRYLQYEASFSHGVIGIGSVNVLEQQDTDILKRFAQVFEQTYRRFLDLQKAEAQAREAQIEAALERVRAKAMAMHNSEDISDATAIVFSELEKLGIVTLRCGIIIIHETKQMDVWTATATAEEKDVRIIGRLDMTIHPALEGVFEAWKKRQPFNSYELAGKDKQNYYEALERAPDYPIPVVPEQYGTMPRQFLGTFNFPEGALFAFTEDALTDETIQLFKRFASVFALTYRRYLDLKHAEEQAREAQIETALERVRARTMAMHQSDELLQTASVVLQQLQALGLSSENSNFAFGIFAEKPGSLEVWQTLHRDEGTPRSRTFSFTKLPTLRKEYQAWKKTRPNQRKNLVFVHDFSGDLLKDYLSFFESQPEFRETVQYLRKAGAERIVHHDACFSHGNISFTRVDNDPLDAEELKILKRFAGVFEQTYRRFLDLQKAEAQAREAQIEAALERVRARTMAMHSSDELADVVASVFQEMTQLDFVLTRCLIWIFDPETISARWWMANAEDPARSDSYRIPHHDHPAYQAFVAAWKARHPNWVYDLHGKTKVSWDDFLFSETELTRLPEEVQAGMRAPDRVILSVSFNNYGALQTAGLEPLSDDNLEILRRFGQVFDMAYTRFDDLKQAEAQAREAQIEAALERVRARTMAMHQSEELHEVIMVVFEQLQSLNLDVEAGFINLHLKESRDHHHLWVAATGQRYAKRLNLPYFDHPYFTRYEEAVANGESLLSDTMTNEDTCRWADHFVEHAQFPVSEERLSYVKSSKGIARSTVLSRDTSLTVWNYKAIPYTADENDVIKRFARVFEQTYTRFLDLQKAEAQAREAQIEAALERVRAKAMGMHTTEDLSSTISILFQELKGLNIAAMRCGVGLIDGATRSVDILTSTTTDEGDALELVGGINLEGHPVAEGIFEHWERQEEYHPVLQGEELKSYYQLLRPGLAVPDWQGGVIQYGHFFYFPEGGLYAWTEEALAEDALRVFRKFASVLGLTYRRHLDLKQAETRAREAEQDASLDRVRAEIASMRTADDLQRITPLIWRELTVLGVPFFRCGLFIVDEPDKVVHAYLSTPTGASLAALKLKFDSLPLVEQTVRYWRKGEFYREEWDQQQFIAWTRSLVEQKLIDSPKQYQAGEEAPEKLVLQLMPFTQGMFYVGSAAPLSDEEIDLAQDLADAFAVAYARYEDFQRLEAAKAEVETAFKELGLLSKELEAKNTELEEENQRKARELEEARRLQLAMLPKKIPKLPNLEIAVYMKTATEVGGDYYDFHLGDDGTLTAVVGDATGHGLKAGTMVTAAKSLFSSLADRPDIAATFRHMSESIKSMRLPLLAMCLTMLKIKDGRMKLSSAGIPPPLIYRSATGKLEEVSVNGMPLGAMAGFPYREKEFALGSGDTVLLMSDGFPERMNDKEKILDYRRAHQAFKKAAPESPKKIIKHLVKAGDDWANGRPQDDDVTFVVIKCRNR